MPAPIVTGARVALWVTGAGAILGLAVVLGGWRPLPWLDDGAVSLAAAGWAAGCALWARRRSVGRMRTSWTLLALTMSTYLVADLLRRALDGVPGTELLLLHVELLYLVAVVPAVAGLVVYPVARGLRQTVGHVLLDATVLGAAVLLLGHVLVFAEVGARAGSAERATGLLVLPVTDVLLACLVLILRLRSVGEARHDVLLLGLAFGAYAVADAGLALLTVRGESDAGTVVRAAYVVAPLLLAAAALTSQLVRTERQTLTRTLSGVWVPVVPDLAAVLVLGVCLVPWLRGPTPWGLAIGLLCLTGARQVVLTAQAHHLRRELEARVAARTTELSELNERHEQLDRAKYSFVGAVSHELRTPLTAIRGSLEMLVDGDAGELPPDAVRTLRLATRGSERLARLVSNIIDLERLETGNFGFSPAAHDLEGVLADAVESLGGIAEQAGVEVVVEPVQVDVWADADQVVQVMVNLVGNALKFAPPGTQVTVDSVVRPGQVEVSVRDQGRGIPQDQLQAVFERFHQVETTIDQEKGGAGLGLAITRRIVEAHGGTIWAESPPSGGACFRFTLPTVLATPEVAPRAPESASAAPALSDAIRGQGGRGTNGRRRCRPPDVVAAGTVGPRP